ncbi:AAA family ATPase [Synoicihabitans lomoniglobus]|uniref:Cytidylate kinase-like family protein n=1 Tax=Synoicihabitans lomoniglobus TaxID=2909285 RepID=A0AAF0CNZ5_9BACT|nr:cytidylate kinase-like family protein [Opitutaceae bacterium LMO-M01]WED65316.1 cytidylate kinase-like family protein [Opitutaceae bacterium LMO-M01]
MNINPNLEKTGSYINLHLARTAPVTAPLPTAPFITICRESGAGATSLATLLAQQLNRSRNQTTPVWRIFDDNLVETMLREKHYPERFARFLPEDTVSEINAAIGEITGVHPNLWEMVQKTNALIRRLATEGRCLLVGRSANFASRGLPNGLHIRLVADTADRARHMAAKLGVSEEAAHRHITHQDSARDHYAREHFSRDIHDPRAYDVVINTSRVPLVEASIMITNMVAARTLL